ncbi:TPR repeat protein [Caenispirillum salinarum AK4]|uniref:TPR repeat protein n=1 Tax=Caenispirillum salinarum AK4 TaxID=1238182 RepID=K9GNY3_9PROT|nr:tetratricopeptide repeat protein [Caenispirillum salinarum]EKV26857.1 TPR repeat protein [Caenispirillum salinarum AK4]
MTRLLPRLTLPLLALAALPAAAQDAAPDPAAKYAQCMELAETRPDRAWELAGQWAGLAGGEPARHCQAVALIGLGEYAEAATRLEKLAEVSRAAEALRAGMLAQAAQAWLMADNAERAYAVQSTALELLPGDPALLTDRALTLVEAGDVRGAIDDLTRVLDARPRDAGALALRASAFRMAGDPVPARADLDRALSIDPAHPAALLEKGILARQSGDVATARAAWLALLDAAPDSPEADTARAHLQVMDGG